MKSALKLELAEARVMSLAALAKAKEIGVTETVCITDEGGFPLVLER
ncbi:MAG: heme-binding protein, partial [Comamonas sp.]